MPRTKGSKNKLKAPAVEQFTFTAEQRVKFVANLVIEKIIEDQQFGGKLVSILENQDAA
jgi:hypothetical protein